jgi:hypothetical protein
MDTQTIPFWQMIFPTLSGKIGILGDLLDFKQ